MKKPRIRNTRETFVDRATAKHGDRYDYSLVVFKTLRTKVEILCREHGAFWQEPLNHINGSGCPACAGCKRTTVEDFITRSKKAHGDRYDYSRVKYGGVDAKVTIICPEHGAFEQVAYDHMNGRGCAKCGAEKAVRKRTHTKEVFVRRAMTAFGDSLDYSRVAYVNSTTKVEIVCPEHGSFFQTPHEHLESTGCPSCSSVARVSRDEFIDRAKSIHGDKYDYTTIEFFGMGKKVDVKCLDHGLFRTLPKDHIAKMAGCQKCASERTSSVEERHLADWIESIGEEVDRNNREVLGGFEIDIYLPDRKIGIEYNGAYWHHDERMAHPRIHEKKAMRASNLGIRLITVWDFDWKQRQDMVKRHILHAIGRHDGTKINARQCIIKRVSFDEARPFYDRTHIQGAPWRAMCHYGLFSDGAMVACMSFGQGASRRGKTGSDEWELMRFSTDGIVRGGASKLFNAFIGERNPTTVWSFSDCQHFGGGLYVALGFGQDGRVQADYRVVSIGKARVWHKSAWKRKHIPARLAELGIDEPYDPDTDPRTEREMQKLAGTVRIMDAGKIRWKWENKNARTGRALSDAA